MLNISSMSELIGTISMWGCNRYKTGWVSFITIRFVFHQIIVTIQATKISRVWVGCLASRDMLHWYLSELFIRYLTLSRKNIAVCIRLDFGKSNLFNFLLKLNVLFIFSRTVHYFSTLLKMQNILHSMLILRLLISAQQVKLLLVQK